MDYQQLEKQTVAQLREMAKEHEDLKGVSGMKKQELVDALAARLGLQQGPEQGAVGGDKRAVKAQIRALKKVRDEAIQAKDRVKIKQTRQQLHDLRRQLRKAARASA